MSQGYLNLENTGFDNLEGQLIKINNIDYQIVEIIAVGGEKIVVALKNLNTGLTLHAGKIYKAKFGSPLYESVKEAAVFAGYIHFLDDNPSKTTEPVSNSYADLYVDSLRLIDVGSGLDLSLANIIFQKVPRNKKSVLDVTDPYEIFEFGGGLIQLQSILNISDYPENYHDRINQAAELFHLREFAKLEAFVEEILQINPNHTDALLFKGATLCFNGLWQEGVNLMQNVIALEPNVEEYYFTLADILIAMKKPHYALQVLVVGVNQHKLNILLFERLMMVVHEWGFIDLRATCFNLFSGKLNLGFVDYLTDQYRKSLESFIKFREHFDAGIELQLKLDWEKASEKMQLASNSTTRTCWGYYNLAICNFQLGNFEQTIKLLENEFFLPALPELEAYILLLTGMSKKGIGDITGAMILFEEIANRYTTIYDMPTIPIAFVFADDHQMGGIQAKSFPSIIKCITEILDIHQENIKLRALLILYTECEAAYQDT